MKLEESIRNYASTQPDKVAVVCGATIMTYSELWQRIEERSKELIEAGVKAHRPYVFKGSQDIDFLATYCAVHNIRAIAVPLEAQIPDEAMAAIVEQVEACSYTEDVADILFTTGTTGRSKGVMLSEIALTTCTDNFITNLGFSSDLAFIVSGPLNHIASLSKINPTLTMGGTICILDGLRDLNLFFDLFNLPFKRFATFLVPTSIHLILQLAYDKLKAVADKIEFIETGAAPITHHDMKQLSELLPNARLFNTLGGTEIGAVCTYNYNDGRYIEGCVGRAMKNSVIEIAEDGHLIISGGTIMNGYVGDKESTDKVLRDGKIHSSDIGYFDEEGMIRLRGREGDVINVGGYKIDPTEVEGAIASHPAVYDSICVADTHPIIGTVLKLLVVLAEGYELDKRSLALHIKAKLEPYKVPTYYEAVEAIQRTYNGKLDRKFYKK